MEDDCGETSAGEVQLGAAAEATVLAYHQLAMDEDKRLHLALDDTCLQFLSLVIGNGDNVLASAALATLSSLAESPECRAPMASTFGVLHCLKASVEEENEHTEDMKTQSAELFTCLNFAYHQQKASRRRSRMPPPPDEDQDPKNKSAPSNEDKTTSSKHAASNKDSSSTKQSDTNKKHRESENKIEDKVQADKDTDRGTLIKSESVESNCSSLSQSSCSQPSQRAKASPSAGHEERTRNKYYRDPKHRTRMITLHVRGMHTPSERMSVEGALVRVRGVISLVFDLARSRVACRVRRVLDLSKLGTAVTGLNMNMTLYQVVTKNKGEEIQIPLSFSMSRDAASPGTSPRASPAKEGGDEEVAAMPDYLPEDEDDECIANDDPHSAVATTGVAIKEAASSLFTAAASLLTQSFYW